MQKKIWIFHLSQQEFLFWTIGWPWRSNFEVKQYWNIMRSIKFMVCTFHFNFNLYSTFHSTPGKVITWYASLTLSLTSIPPQGHLVQPHTLHIQNLWWEKRWMGVQDCGNHGREFELQVYLTVWVTLFSNGKNGATGWTFSPLQMESSGEKTLTDPSMAWLVNFHKNYIL